MINLLAPDLKRQIRAARVNVILTRYSIMLGLTAIAVAAIFGAGMWLTWQERAEAESRKTQNEQIAATYSDTRKQAESFIADLRQAKTILGNDFSFYNLMTQIASAVPAGVILSNLSLGTATLNTPITISAKATTYENAIKLKNNLAGSSIFDTVNLVNAATTAGGNDPTSSRYPVTVTLSATFSKTFISGANK